MNHRFLEYIFPETTESPEATVQGCYVKDASEKFHKNSRKRSVPACLF